MELGQVLVVLPTIEDTDQQTRVNGIFSLYHGDEDASKGYYERVLELNRTPNKVFSPLFYLYLMTCLFPEREDIRNVREWFRAKVNE